MIARGCFAAGPPDIAAKLHVPRPHRVPCAYWLFIFVMTRSTYSARRILIPRWKLPRGRKYPMMTYWRRRGEQ